MPINYSVRTQKIAEERLQTVLYDRFPGLNEEKELAIIKITKSQLVFGPRDGEIIQRLLSDEIKFLLDTRDRDSAADGLIQEDEVAAVASWLTKFFAYREELEEMDPPDIAALYFEVEQRRKVQMAARAAEHDRHEFFNEAPAVARFEHWLGLAHWTSDEAIALSLGKDPRVVNRKSLHHPYGTSPFVREYRRRTDQVIRAQEAGQLESVLKTANFLDWVVKTADWEVPPELQIAANKINLLEDVTGRSVGTYYKIVVAMAICHYGLDPKEVGAFSSIGQAIADDMTEVGLKFSGRAIDELLKRAYPAVAADTRVRTPSKAWKERRKKPELP